MRKNCATKAVKIMLTHTTTLCAADLISNGNSSLGTNHPKGPHDLPYAKTNKKITITRKILAPNDSCFPFPNSKAKTIAVTICNFKKKKRKRNPQIRNQMNSGYQEFRE